MTSTIPAVPLLHAKYIPKRKTDWSNLDTYKSISPLAKRVKLNSHKVSEIPPQDQQRLDLPSPSFLLSSSHAITAPEPTAPSDKGRRRQTEEDVQKERKEEIALREALLEQERLNGELIEDEEEEGNP